MKDVKVSYDWGTNIITIQGTCTIQGILLVTKKLVQTKRPKILICYDFHFGILDEEEDMMFTTKLDLFSISFIVVPTHIKPVSKPVYLPNFNIIEVVPKQPIELMLCVLNVNLVIPLDTVK